MISVVDFDLEWPKLFAALSQRYGRTLVDVDVVAIEHVGSTSVPGLAAKPVIDVDIVVERRDVDAAVTALESIGFESLGDLGITDRWAMREPAGWIRTNTYVVVAGSAALRNHLAVRDALRADDRLRDRYGALKRWLATETDDIDVCIDGKSSLLLGILEDAGMSADERAAIADSNRLSSP